MINIFYTLFVAQKLLIIDFELKILKTMEKFDVTPALRKTTITLKKMFHFIV